MTLLGAVFNLNEPAHVVHWHFFQMSVANVAVIVAMLVVFALAIVLPFPGTERRRAAREQGPRPPGPRPPGSHPAGPRPVGPPGPSAGPPGAGLGVPTPARIENEP